MDTKRNTQKESKPDKCTACGMGIGPGQRLRTDGRGGRFHVRCWETRPPTADAVADLIRF